MSSKNADQSPVVIKKYANRRLYHTGESAYVTLEDLAEMIRRDEDFIVKDAKSGEDLTRSVLTQIIFEQEAKGENLLPVNFLRQIISFYGNSVEKILPSYLDFSMSNFIADQEKLHQQFNENLAKIGLGSLEEQTRKNMELFQQGMNMFMPFGAKFSENSAQETSENENELDSLRQQMKAMQDQLNALIGQNKK